MWDFVQAVESLTDTPTSNTLTLTITGAAAGNRLFVASYVQGGGASPATNTLTDDGGNPYLGPSARISQTGTELSVWDTVIGQTGTLVVSAVASLTPAQWTLSALEYSGLVSSLTDYIEDMDTNTVPGSGGAGPATYAVGPSIDSALDGNLAIAFGASGSEGDETVSIGAGWTTRLNSTPRSSASFSVPIVVQDQATVLGQGATAYFTEVTPWDVPMALALLLVKRFPQPDATRPLTTF